MIRQSDNAPFSQRQLRVGELIKQSLGQIFLRDEAKLPTLITKNITVTEVRMSPILKMLEYTLYLWVERILKTQLLC